MIDFAGKFFPRVFGVYVRDFAFWEEKRYKVFSPRTSNSNIGFVRSGEGEVRVNEESFPLKAGDIFHFSKNQKMTMISSQGKNHLNYICVHYDFKQVSWKGSELQMEDSLQTDLPMARVISDKQLGAEIRLEELHAIWMNKGAGYERKVNLFFRLFIYELLEQLQTHSIAQDYQHEAILTTIDYIKQHYREPIERDKLAQMIAVAPSYYSKIFKKYTSYTLTQFIHKLRIDHAKQMLLSTREPIFKIAMEIGFNDPLYFTRIFTRETGMTPSAYREGQIDGNDERGK